MRIFETPLGPIEINVLGHASLLIKWNNKNIFTDPYSEVCDYSRQPKADLVIITHDHYDHLDKTALQHIVTPQTIIISNAGVHEAYPESKAVAIGESVNYEGIEITATFAYNIKQMNDQGEPFHPKGIGNGYILNFNGFRIYLAGDTELIPEMSFLGDIDLAFLPKNLPYTMSDGEFLEAIKVIKPKNVIPYHYFELDADYLKKRVVEGVNLICEF